MILNGCGRLLVENFGDLVGAERSYVELGSSSSCVGYVVVVVAAAVAAVAVSC